MSDSTESVVAPESPTAAVGSVPDAASRLGAEVDSLFGYRAPAATQTTAPEPDDEAEGDTPSPSSETSDDAAETAQPEQAGATPAVAGQETDDDPLQHAEPLSYTVSGQQRSDERIKVVKDLGAFIEPKDLPHIQQRLSERDHLYETNREQYAKYQALEKLTEWKQGDTVLTGPPAIEAQRVFVEQSKETIRQLASVLKPENFAKYVDIGQNEDGSYFVQPNQAALNDLRERLQFANDRAGFEEKRRFASLAPTISQPVVPQAADAPIETLADPTVDALAQQLGVTLSPDAKTFLASQLPRYVRPTTDAEKPQFGPRIVDSAFADLIKREARSAATVAKVAETASTAATRNAPRLAAAMIGRGKAPVARTTPKQTSDEDELTQEEQAYLARERAGANALRARAS